jgi:hypothetical protein
MEHKKVRLKQSHDHEKKVSAMSVLIKKGDDDIGVDVYSIIKIGRL